MIVDLLIFKMTYSFYVLQVKWLIVCWTQPNHCMLVYLRDRSAERIFMYCHTEIEVADQSCFLSHSILALGQPVTGRNLSDTATAKVLARNQRRRKVTDQFLAACRPKGVCPKWNDCHSSAFRGGEDTELGPHDSQPQSTQQRCQHPVQPQLHACASCVHSTGVCFCPGRSPRREPCPYPERDEHRRRRWVLWDLDFIVSSKCCRGGCVLFCCGHSE